MKGSVAPLITANCRRLHIHCRRLAVSLETTNAGGILFPVSARQGPPWQRTQVAMGQGGLVLGQSWGLGPGVCCGAVGLALRCRLGLGAKQVQPQHAAACRSMPQHIFFGAAHGGFEACRSMPQHPFFGVHVPVCLAVFFVRRPRSACHVEGTFSLMGHIQTKDRLHMGNNTLRHLAMMYVNKPTTDDPDGESD